MFKKFAFVLGVLWILFVVASYVYLFVLPKLGGQI